MLASALIGLTRIGGTSAKIAERVYTYSGIPPTRSAWVAPVSEIYAPGLPWATSQALDRPERSTWQSIRPEDAEHRIWWYGKKN